MSFYSLVLTVNICSPGPRAHLQCQTPAHTEASSSRGKPKVDWFLVEDKTVNYYIAVSVKQPHHKGQQCFIVPFCCRPASLWPLSAGPDLVYRCTNPGCGGTETSASQESEHSRSYRRLRDRTIYEVGKANKRLDAIIFRLLMHEPILRQQGLLFS